MIVSLLKPLVFSLAGNCVLMVPGQPAAVQVPFVPAPLLASVHTQSDSQSGCVDIYLQMKLPHGVVTTRLGAVAETGAPVCWGHGIALLCGIHLDAQGRVSAVIVNFH